MELAARSALAALVNHKSPVTAALQETARDETRGAEAADEPIASERQVGEPPRTRPSGRISGHQGAEKASYPGSVKAEGQQEELKTERVRVGKLLARTSNNPN
jgi:hypothetical protein